jgi:organic radical activating enzyme
MTTNIFCPHAFNALEVSTTGRFKPCCISSRTFKDDNNVEFFASKSSIVDVYNSGDRKDFIDNFDEYFPTECSQCYQVEASGGSSKRLREIKYWELYYDGVEAVPTFTRDQNLEVLDLKLGNTCNLACATCDSHSSTKWNSLFKEFTGEFETAVTRWQDDDKFWNDLVLNLSNIKKIELAGGEPFLNKKQKIMLKYLVDNDLAKDIDIAWITNCTQYDEEVISLFKHFKLVRVMISLDNTGKQFEYMRYPAAWDDSYQIFLKFVELKNANLIELGISHTISLLNIYHLPEMWEFARKHQVMLFNNLVMWPFHCRNLPEDFKQTVKARLEAVTDPSYQLNPANGANTWLVEFMLQSNENDSIMERMKAHLKFVNRTRQDLFEAAFPELLGIV